MQVLMCILDGRIPAVPVHFSSSWSLWISAGCLSAWPASPSCLLPIFPKAHTSAHLSLLLMHRASTQVWLLSLWCLSAALCIWHVDPFSVWHGMPFLLHLYIGGCCAPRKFVVNSVHHAQDSTPSNGRRAQQQCREWRCQFLCWQLSPLFRSLGRTAFSFIK